MLNPPWTAAAAAETDATPDTSSQCSLDAETHIGHRASKAVLYVTRDRGPSPYRLWTALILPSRSTSSSQVQVPVAGKRIAASSPLEPEGQTYARART